MDISTLKTLGKKWWLCTSVHNYFPCAIEISFLHTKVCRNAPFPIDSMIFQMVKCAFIPSGIFHLFFLKYSIIFNGFILKLQGEISSFLTGMAFLHVEMPHCLLISFWSEQPKNTYNPWDKKWNVVRFIKFLVCSDDININNHRK